MVDLYSDVDLKSIKTSYNNKNAENTQQQLPDNQQEDYDDQDDQNDNMPSSRLPFTQNDSSTVASKSKNQIRQPTVFSLNDYSYFLSEDGLKSILHSDYHTRFKNVLWTSDINQELPIKIQTYDSEDYYGFGTETPLTICQNFFKQIDQFKNEVCMQMKRRVGISSAGTDSNATTQVQYINVQYTWDQFFDKAMLFAKALHQLGIKEKQCVSLMGYNSPEHFIALMGTYMANCITTEIYLTNGPESCYKQIVHSKSKIIICDTLQTYKEKFLPFKNEYFQLGIKQVIMFGELTGERSHQRKRKDIRLYNWAQALNIGENIENQVIFRRLRDQQPGQCCNLVYTSGTTGDSKGVMLSHDNMTWYWSVQNKLLALRNVNGQDYKTQTIHQVSYLPLSHITAQMSDFMRTICSNQPVMMTFAQPDALFTGSLIETLREARPTEFLAVPRIYEKLRDLIKDQMRESSPMKRSLFKWAKEKGYQNLLARKENEPSPFGYNLSKLMILNKIKQQLGFDRIDKLYYGAAPLSFKVKKFFASLNMPLINVYGLSESSAATTYTDDPNQREQGLNKAGRAFPGTQIKIFNPDEIGMGEICLRGRNIFMGYLDSEQDTFEVFDSEGYFHTGDMGFLDQNGSLEITGRIKELIITAGGENVSPLPIETQLKDACPLIRHAVIIGDEKKYLTCLFTLKTLFDNQSGKPTNILTPEVLSFVQTLNSKAKTSTQAIEDSNILTFIQKCVDQVNNKAVSRVSQIKKWRIIDQDFSIDGGELTPTMKIKRKYIVKKFHDVIEQLYHEPKL
eukprot:403377473